MSTWNWHTVLEDTPTGDSWVIVLQASNLWCSGCRKLQPQVPNELFFFVKHSFVLFLLGQSFFRLDDFCTLCLPIKYLPLSSVFTKLSVHPAHTESLARSGSEICSRIKTAVSYDDRILVVALLFILHRYYTENDRKLIYCVLKLWIALYIFCRCVIFSTKIYILFWHL